MWGRFGDRQLRRWLPINPDGLSIHILSTNAIDLPGFEDPLWRFGNHKPEIYPLFCISSASSQNYGKLSWEDGGGPENTVPYQVSRQSQIITPGAWCRIQSPFGFPFWIQPWRRFNESAHRDFNNSQVVIKLIFMMYKLCKLDWKC